MTDSNHDYLTKCSSKTARIQQCDDYTDPFLSPAEAGPGFAALHPQPAAAEQATGALFLLVLFASSPTNSAVCSAGGGRGGHATRSPQHQRIEILDFFLKNSFLGVCDRFLWSAQSMSF